MLPPFTIMTQRNSTLDSHGKKYRLTSVSAHFICLSREERNSEHVAKFLAELLIEASSGGGGGGASSLNCYVSSDWILIHLDSSYAYLLVAR